MNPDKCVFCDHYCGRDFDDKVKCDLGKDPEDYCGLCPFFDD